MVDDSPGALRIVAGQVDKDGNRISGEGFDPSRVSQGKYHIVFRASFLSIYGACATQVGFSGGPNETTDNALIYDIAHGGMFVSVGDADGSVEDRAFSFIAVGV